MINTTSILQAASLAPLLITAWLLFKIKALLQKQIEFETRKNARKKVNSKTKNNTLKRYNL